MSSEVTTTGDRLERHRKRILIADDSETYRAVASRVLEDAGYQVTTVVDGAEALAHLESAEPLDLVLLELNLPKVRGLDLVRRVRETERLSQTVMLVVSESLTEHLRRVLKDLRVDASLTKNHALRDLLYQVDALLFPRAADERASRRQLENLPVNYWHEDQLYLESCFDVSEVGMFVIVPDEKPPVVGSSLSLRFWLPTADRLIICEGVVVWHNTIHGDLKVTHPPGMGLRFTSISEPDRALVSQFLQRYD